MDVLPFELECLEEDQNGPIKMTQLSLKYCGLVKFLSFIFICQWNENIYWYQFLACVVFLEVNYLA